MGHIVDALDLLIWTPGELQPVVAGRVVDETGVLSFRYDPGYLGQPDAISIFDLDLPLGSQQQLPPDPHRIAPSLRDALPDMWGRRVIAAGLRADGIWCGAEDEIDDITLMLRTSPDRIGALGFSRPGTVPSTVETALPPLEELVRLVDIVDDGEPVPSELRPLLPHCASVGGARPKALFSDAQGGKFIAKFGMAGDYLVVQGEFVAMRLAEHAGISVAPVQIEQIDGRPVLLVGRFDRAPHSAGGEMRHHMVSALTWTQVGEMSARHITYPQLAAIMEAGFADPARDKAEMFVRILFNILVGNTDDHARNHAAFCDGKALRLTPAYDISPQRRSTRSANLAMALANGSRAATLANAAAVAPAFGISDAAFQQILDRLVGAIAGNWAAVCDEAGLTQAEREAFAGRQFLNEFAFEGFGRTPSLRRSGTGGTPIPIGGHTRG